MAIPASYIVDIEPRVISGGSSNLEMNGLVFTKSELVPTGSVRELSSASAVGEYFGVTSLEYLAASAYFTAYENKWAAPRRIMFSRRIDEDVAAWIRSAAVTATLAELKAVTDGTLTLTVDGSSVAASSVDFSEATSLSECAEILGEALGGLECSYSSLTKAFTINSATVGEDSTIDFAAASEEGDGTDLAVLLGFTESAGAVISQGANAMTEAEQLEAVRGVTENWYSFTTAWQAEPEEALAWGKWAAQNYGWMYVPWSVSAVLLNADSDQDMASQLRDAGYDHVAPIYGTIEYAAFIMGCCGAIDWTRTNSTITFAFKRQSGLGALVTRLTDAETLVAKRCNFIGDFACRNSSFVDSYAGVLSAGDYGYIDPYINSVWFNNRLQVSIMDGLTLAARVPYTERGYAMIRAWMMDPVNEARNNGVIEYGVTLSESQKSELFNEAGVDISDQLWTQGYFIQIKDPGASVRAERGTPSISIWYTYGGAVHKIVVGSTAVL